VIIAIDGPSGTGKSSVSRALAERLGLPHLDTGAFYRAATVAVLEAGADPLDRERCHDVVKGIQIDQGGGHTYLNGRNVTEEIRVETIDLNVSAVSSHPEVRAIMVDQQRQWLRDRGGSGVVEGRDIGSVVFSDADIKIYLDARREVRAKRRAEERGKETEEVADAIESRDHFDSTRRTSPLTVPEGAVTVDTSDLTLNEVVDRLAGLITSRP
jgi:cytidylate kinase